MQADNLDLGGLFRETRFLCKCLFACPPGHSVDVGLNTSIEKVVRGSQHDFVYATDLPAKRDAIRRLVLDQGCEQMGIPAWLSDHPDEQHKQLQTRLGCTRNDVAQLEAELKALRHEPEMARARANIDTLHWYLNHASGYLSGGDLCHVTGWTRATDLHTPQLALRAAKIEAIVRFPNPPPELTPPVTLLDTSWSHLFQPLLGLWGTPGRTEVDPSGLLSFIVPLMFGYMFPDVGHGLILALFAAAVWRKWPRLRFLLPCGLASMGFGALFGEVFGLHHLIQPLWTHPLEQPVLILAVPLVFGVGLMLLGLVFAGMEAKWRGELRTWLPMEGAVLVLYASALAGLVWPQAGWLSALALLEYCLASLLLASAGERLLKFLHALGELLLSLFELTMNTLSFLRVGAFAIAHAALSYAILSLADATSSPWAWTLVILLGNLFAIVMEGLLVFVQTTRLVLFEFFIRFLSADGRLFRALPLATKGRQA
jgi:V/A-type H+-transporting ATPase subunit I